MIRSSETLRLKDISIADQETMGLEWAWKAGAIATYVREFGHDYYHSEQKPCSLIEVHHLSANQPRELWVFDMFLEAGCIWSS